MNVLVFIHPAWQKVLNFGLNKFTFGHFANVKHHDKILCALVILDMCVRVCSTSITPQMIHCLDKILNKWIAMNMNNSFQLIQYYADRHV